MTQPEKAGHLPPEISDLRQLGNEVRDVLASAGIPVRYQPDPRIAPVDVPGAHVYLYEDLRILGVRWACTEDLVTRSLEASRVRDYDNIDVRLNVAAASAMGNAIARILAEAGYETGLEVDMDPFDVWVRRAPDKPRSDG